MNIDDLLKRNESCIYCLEFPNGKKYVGKTSHLGNRIRLYVQSEKTGTGKVHDAIREFGFDSITLSVLSSPKCSSKDDLELCLSILEIKYIRDLDTIYPNGLNISFGGEALRIPPECITTDARAIKAFKNGSKVLLVYDGEGNFVEEYESIARFAYDKGFDEDNVREAVDKQRAFMGKYILRTQKYGYNPQKIDVSNIRVVERVKYKTIVEENVVYREREKFKVPALAYDMNGDFVGEYPSRSDAARCLTGVARPHWGIYNKGYIFFRKVDDNYPKKIESALEFKGKIIEEEYKPVSELRDMPSRNTPSLKNAGAYKLRNDYPINQFTLYGDFVKQYPSIRAAAQEMAGEVSYSQIYSCVKGNNKRGGDYIWQKADEVITNEDVDKNTIHDILPLRRNGKHENLNNSFPVAQYTLDGELVKIHANMRDAADETGILYANIWACIKGSARTSHGFVWKRADEKAEETQKEKDIDVKSIDVTQDLFTFASE